MVKLTGQSLQSTPQLEIRSLHLAIIISKNLAFHQLDITVLDTTIFTVDVFTDVANGVNLVRGPAKNSNSIIGNTSTPGRITKPYPIWGSQMIAIPFLPMLVHGFGMASLRWNPWMYLTSCGDLESSKGSNLVLCLLLAIPFTIVATPWYICYVIFVGCRRVVRPQHENNNSLNRRSANFKSTEVLLESALQTSLGRLSILAQHFSLPRCVHPVCPWDQQ